MAYCRQCGAQIDEDAAFCSHCGAPQGRTEQTSAERQGPYVPGWATQPPQEEPRTAPMAANDTGSIGWGILGFFVPLVGLILFLIWREEKPRSAKVAGIGALAGVIVSVVLMVLFWLVFGLLFWGVVDCSGLFY